MGPGFTGQLYRSYGLFFIWAKAHGLRNLRVLMDGDCLGNDSASTQNTLFLSFKLLLGQNPGGAQLAQLLQLRNPVG